MAAAPTSLWTAEEAGIETGTTTVTDITAIITDTARGK